jgi:polysaccharide deacetylase family protein (PEP-CTERM system associated)
MLNALTIDLEDWAQSVIDPTLPITDRVVVNTHRVLDWLNSRRIRATFFVLGKACERYPELLPAVAAAGHEIGTHGYGHELVFHLTPDQFRDDVERSIEVIESQIGVRPIGYRAPAFSITRRSLWAIPILEELGIRYSSSIFPIHHRRYGIPDAPLFPYRWHDCDMIEFPITTFRALGRSWPCVGGGYTRLLPAALMQHAVAQTNDLNQPAVVYLHPYEFAPGEVRGFQRDGVGVSRRRRWSQELWRSRVEPRLSALADRFALGPMREVLGLSQPPDREPFKEDSSSLELTRV